MMRNERQIYDMILKIADTDEHPDYPSDKQNFYGWLMQFMDGNRIEF